MADRIQMLGETMSLGGGNSVETSGFSSGTIQDSETGRMPLGRAPSPLGVFTDQSMGEIQDENTGRVPLNRKAHRGYESGGTPIAHEDEINP